MMKNVTAHPLQAGTVPGGDAPGGLQIEPAAQVAILQVGRNAESLSGRDETLACFFAQQTDPSNRGGRALQ